MLTFIALVMSFILGWAACWLYTFDLRPPMEVNSSTAAVYSLARPFSSSDRTDYFLSYPYKGGSRTFVANSVDLNTGNLQKYNRLAINVRYDETDEQFEIDVQGVSSSTTETIVQLFFGSLDTRTPALREYFNDELVLYAYGYSRPNGQLNGLHVIQMACPFGGATGTETFRFMYTSNNLNNSDIMSLFSDGLAGWQFFVARTSDFEQQTRKLLVSSPSYGSEYVSYLSSPWELYNISEFDFTFSPPITSSSDTYSVEYYLFGTYLNGARIYWLPKNNVILDLDDFYLLSATLPPTGHVLRYYNSSGDLINAPFSISDSSLVHFDVENFLMPFELSFYQTSELWDAPMSIVNGVNQLLSVDIFGIFSLGDFLLIAGCILLGFFFLKIFMGG